MTDRSYHCFLFRMTKTLVLQQLPTVVHSTISLLIQLSYIYMYTFSETKKHIHIHPVTLFLLCLSPGETRKHFFDENIFSIGIFATSYAFWKVICINTRCLVSARSPCAQVPHPHTVMPSWQEFRTATGHWKLKHSGHIFHYPPILEDRKPEGQENLMVHPSESSQTLH